MRKMLLTCVVALAVAAPAQAGEGRAKGRELKISGPIVRVSEQAVSVENAVGDALLTCAVPERLAEKMAGFKAGDKVRMLCVRFRGRRAQLVKLERLGDRGKRPEKPAALVGLCDLRIRQAQLAGLPKGTRWTNLATSSSTSFVT